MKVPSSLPLPAAYALRKLGHDLALARRRRGISTEDMASRLFVGRAILGRMERGDPLSPWAILQLRLLFISFTTVWPTLLLQLPTLSR